MKKIVLVILYILPMLVSAQKKKANEVNFMVTSANLKVVDAKTEQLVNPMGLDIQQPRFSWILESTQKNTFQIAYEITIATADDFNKKSIYWSDKKNTDQSIYNKYTGPALASNTRYYWFVKVWDNHGNIATSSLQYWHTGFFTVSEWTAHWIGVNTIPTFNENLYPSPMLRKDFSLTKEIKSANLFISSKGLYEAHINGQKVGNDFLTPGWTSYNTRTQYQVYDVTTMIKKGRNAIGAMLGKGWYKGEVGWIKNAEIYGNTIGLIAQLIIKLSDGTTQVINSDESWKYGFGPIMDSEIYHGEKIDARRNVEGWDKPDFIESGWTPVRILQAGKNNLIGSYSTPVRKKEMVKPIKLIITPENDTVLDFGQNMVGWVKMKVTGNAGTTIKIQHAEVLDKKGNFYTANLRRAKQENVYTLSGKGQESFEPHFTFQGFRYIKVSGYPSGISLDKFEGIALYSDLERTGQFECSNSLINQLQQNIQWGQRGNFVDVPTDCPQRDERLGWTGDAQAFSRTAAYNFNVQNFFAKWLQDLAADQRPDGGIPHVIPNALGQRDVASAGWADAGTIIPWNMYWIYGDTSFLTRQYTSMKNWVKYMEDSSRNDLWNKGFHFGDWLFYSLGDDTDGRSAVTDKYLIAQCFFAHSTQLVLDAAKVLGKKEDIAYYTTLLEKVKSAFRKEYVTGSGRLVSGTQTAYVLALQFDMLDPAQRGYAAELLVKNIKAYNNHITTGFLGTPYICHVLSKFGYSDLAYMLLFQDSYPSWLYPVKMGATTIWERWDGIKPDGSFQNAGMNSFNHYAYGAIGDWMYRVVTGIEIEKEGYKKSIINPIISGSLNYATSYTNTPYGKIQSGWYKNENSLDFSVEIPANTTSTIYLPVSNIEKLIVDGMSFSSSPYVKNMTLGQNSVKLELGSGKYSFKLIN